MFIEPTKRDGLLYLPNKRDGNLAATLVQVTCLTINVTLDRKVSIDSLESLIPNNTRCLSLINRAINPRASTRND